LIKGSVEVTVKNRGETYSLKPNEKFVIANNIAGKAEDVQAEIKSIKEKKKVELPKSLISIQPLNYYQVDSAILETSWVDNRLIFQKNESFREVALKMERWYGIQIMFTSEKVAEYRPFGSFGTETITQALDALKEGFRFNYKRIGDNSIVITE
jgi:transmembrane sensor